jgi:hypothetical protein
VIQVAQLVVAPDDLARSDVAVPLMMSPPDTVIHDDQ